MCFQLVMLHSLLDYQDFAEQAVLRTFIELSKYLKSPKKQKNLLKENETVVSCHDVSFQAGFKAAVGSLTSADKLTS